ncbi:MAG: NAD(P)H-quinone oxidoreductase [Gemmatimonadaceae bacterium]|nr:NAD(P)H-quinone oxidoreductase [Gemmatimonadaceae bacterium]
MRAAIITSFGGPEVLAVREVSDPVAGEAQVLVRVRASALNRADILQRLGRYPAPPGAPTDVAGIEFAGEVAACGPGVTRWQPGDRVYGITGGGGHAQLLVAHERTIVRIPDRWSFIEAAAIPEAFITAHDALVSQAGLEAGESVLIHAIGSGVGLAASQLAHALGARVFGTTRSRAKLDRAREFGMDDGLVVGDTLDTLGSAVDAFTAGAGIHVTLDLLGGPYLGASLRVAALRGRVMLVGTIAGATSTLDHRIVLARQLTLRGTVLRPRSLAEKVAASEAFDRDVTPLLAAGSVRPVVDCVFPLGEIAAAHAAMESNTTFGKVVVDLG